MFPQLKSVVAINAVAATQSASATSAAIDTLGFDWATIDVWGTSQSATSLAASPASLKLQESDAATGTFTDIVGFRGGSATATNIDFVVGTPVAASNVPSYKFNVDLRARKRYLAVSVSPGTSATLYAIANLGRGEQSPSTATKANVLSLIEG